MKISKIPGVKKIAIAWCLILLAQICMPTITYALTSGPSQPEVQSFEPVGTTQMVDLQSGDFNYNIPLLSVGSYPINIAYHAGVGMEDEASWVGLGWNLNPGAINRSMRGLPDDFSGEVIKKEVDIKDNITVEFGLGPEFEIGGFGTIALSTGVRYNNYKGLAITQNVNIAPQSMGAFKMNLGLGFDSGEGISVTPSLSLSHSMSSKSGKANFSGSLNIGAPYNSRTGMSELTFTRNFSGSVNYQNKRTGLKHTIGAGVGTSGSLISFNTPSYITSSDQNSRSYAFNLKIGLGADILPFLDTKIDIKGSYSQQKTLGDRSFPAYGYLYHHLTQPGISLMDFNREKDGPYYKSSNSLPLTSLTYDSYSISGQGVGGAYRPQRNDVGYVADPGSSIDNNSDEFGGDIAPGVVPVSFKVGINYSHQQTDGRAGLWSGNNAADDTYYYGKRPGSTSNSVQAKFEPTYFQQVGELTANKGRYEGLAKNDPLHFDLTGANRSPSLQNTLKDKSGANRSINGLEQDRAIRSQPMSALTINEAKRGAVNKKVSHYLPGLQLNADGTLKKIEKTIHNYTDGFNIKDKQLFQLMVNRPDGARYVYGLPVYNVHQKEVVFNAAGLNPRNYADPSVQYTSADVVDNHNGVDRYSMRETMPAYAYSHLLTSVLSSDYSDRTGDGPTDDDFGDWVKFNYSNEAGTMSNKEPFKWRFPFEEFNASGSRGIANLNEGLKSQSRDDKANFTYGEKELWYTHSIESRAHIAIFFTSDRDDAKGVRNEYGQTNGSSSRPSMQKLDRIEYYAKHDLAEKGEDAVPIKTVHFEYDYSLCPGVPNNLSGNGGKLTLKKLYFHYGNSKKGEFSKYKFGYFEDANEDGLADDEHQNPPYKRRSKDRWGQYKPDALNSGSEYAPSSIGNASVPLSNSDFPYAEQNEETADQNAQAWNLKNIKLPSGGEINVSYEADDYAYVQDRRANQMFTLRGTSQSVPNDLGDLSSNLHSGGDFYNYLVVELPDGLNSTSLSPEDEFYYNYLDGVDHLYFRSLVQIKGGNYEFVPGYTKIEDHGVFHATEGGIDKDFGWIRIKGVGYNENGSNGSVNPIAKAGWQFARFNIPTLVYPGSDVEAGVLQNVIQGLIGLLNELPRMISGLNRSLRREGYCKRIVPNKSWIRLNTPDYVKKGGGCRVQKIELTDNWSKMDDAGQNSTYGQQYFYKTVETTAGGEEKLISSGVATYEPVLGNDENPFKTPITFNESRWLAPDNHHYIERPLGETFFPSASVGYSKVIVADIRPDENINRTATGYSISEFYTAKDFPYKTDHDVGERKLYKPSPLSSLFRFRSKDYAHVSQGYTIQLNDMHGKQKASWSYSGALPYNTITGDLDISTSILNTGNRIAGTEYIYKMNEDNSLNNEVNVILSDGSIDEEYVGLESEMVMDFKENRTSTSNIEIRGDLDMWIIPFFIPITIPLISVIPSYSESETLFRSAVTTKVVNQHGLLDKVRVHKEGSIIETQNLLYDAETGEVLLTSLNNEYKEVASASNPLVNEDNSIYKLKYPAHWAYEGMGPAYQNIGAEQFVSTTASGNNSLTQADKIFYPGDEVLGKGTLTFTIFGLEFDFPYEQKFWVSDVGANHVKFILENGDLLTDGYQVFPSSSLYTLGSDWDMKVMRSGYRNQQTMPIASMTSLKNPATYFLGSGGTNTGSQPMSTQANALEVIDFTAQEYSENWQMFCNGTEITTTECVCEVDYGNLYAISNLFASQHQHGELWTTQQSDIGALTSSSFPWDFEDSDCVYENEHFSTTDLSHVRNLEHAITNLKITENHPVFATSQYYDQNAQPETIAMAYVKDEMVEVAFYKPEGEPTNSIEDVTIRRLFKPEDDLNIVEFIELREHDGSLRYALLYDFVDRNGFSSAVLTVFDQEHVFWSKQFLDQEIIPMDISTYDIYSMYMSYFVPRTNVHHLMKISAANGDVEYDNIITTSGELNTGDPYALNFIIENKGATKRDRFLTVRSAMVRERNQVINRLFIHEAFDEGSTIEMNRTAVWDISRDADDPTRFIPTDIVKHFEPEGQQNARPTPYHFGVGKTTNNEVFIFRVSDELEGNYYLFDPNLNIESVSISHTQDPDILKLHISPKVDVTNIEGALTVTMTNLFGAGFNPAIENVSRFDASNATLVSTIDESRVLGSRTISPTIQVDPVNRTGILRLGNYLEDNGQLSSLADCFDSYSLELFDRVKNEPSEVEVEPGKTRPEGIDVVMLEQIRPDFSDVCCPESITHHVDWSRGCDTCSYTFYLPENADYCLMDLDPICSPGDPAVREGGYCFVPVIPDYEELLEADCDATDHRYFTYFEVDDESSSQHGEIVQIVMTSNCFEPFNCEIQTEVMLCGGEDGTVINPYVHGARGNWRPNKSYIHRQVDRLTASADDQPDLSVQGYYEEFDQFWDRPSGGASEWSPDISQYIKSAEITKYSPYGEALEEKDALGISSAIITGYDKKLPVAVGGNMKYREMGYDGFEEYAFYQAPDQCHAGFHFDLDAYTRLDQKIVHSGYYSLKVKSSHKVSFELECPDGDAPGNSSPTPFAIERCKDCLPNFNPAYRSEKDAENRYVFDCWIHQINNQGKVFIYQLNSLGSVVETTVLEPGNTKIEDWNRVYGFFKLHHNVAEIQVVFENKGSAYMYVDDVRVYPFDGNMKSFVYDPASLQLMAELDENNHATFFEYDEEWNLIRVKKETERGIVTIQEHRTSDRIDRD